MATDLTSTEPKDTFPQLLHVDGGITASLKQVYDGDGTQSVFQLSSAACSIDSLTVTTGLTVTGNIVVSGTVDGRDLAVDGAKLDLIEDGANVGITSESNDLTAAVTWANVPDANITESSVTQHQAALSITESQISDLSHPPTLTTEQVQDIAGAMNTGNTETLITVTYQDADGTIDYVVDSDLSNYSNTTSGFITDITGDPLSNLSDATITSIASGELLKWNGSAWVNNTLTEAGIAAASHTHATSDITSGTFADARISESSVTQYEAALTITESQISDLSHSTPLTTEQVQDIAGAMWAGNTETGATVTYQDADGTIDIAVSDTTVAGDTGSTGMTPGDTLTITGGADITTSMSGDTLTVTSTAINETQTDTAANSSSTFTLVEATSNYHKVTFTSNCTLAFTFTSGAVQAMILQLVNAGAYTVTFPTMQWAGGTEPTFTSSGTDIISVWHNGDNTVYGAVVGQDFS